MRTAVYIPDNCLVDGQLWAPVLVDTELPGVPIFEVDMYHTTAGQCDYVRHYSTMDNNRLAPSRRRNAVTPTAVAVSARESELVRSSLAS